MKEWWQSLSSRERSLVAGLSVFVIILLLYFIVWSPLQSNIDNLQQSVNSNQSLLSWMQQANQALQQQSGNNNGSNATTDPEQRLSTVQQSLQSVDFRKNARQLEQTEKNNVRVIISKAQFDSIINWLNTLWKNNGLVIDSANIKKLDNKGNVSATLTITGKRS